jgi:hypothetical protein
MKVFTSAQFTIPLPEGHRFPMSKYTLLREAVEASGLVAPGNLLVPNRPPTSRSNAPTMRSIWRG